MSADHGSHSSSHGHGDHGGGHTGIYKKIGGVLLVCTVITVIISWLPIKTVAAIVALGLLVATFKASLVAAIFMHLNNEKKIIYWTLILCAALFVPLILLPVLTTSDHGPGRVIAPAAPNMDSKNWQEGGHGEAHGDGHGEAGHEAEPAAAGAEHAPATQEGAPQEAH